MKHEGLKFCHYNENSKPNISSYTQLKYKEVNSFYVCECKAT